MFLRRLSHRTLFSLPPSSSKLPKSISRLPRLCHSHSHPDSRNVRVSVWWDLHSCTVPPGVNACRVAPAITAAIESCGLKGHIEITALGDMSRLSTTNQEALSSTAGINLRHIPPDGEDDDSADRSLRRSLHIGLMHWVSQNPSPAHVFMISGDTDFSSILHHLRMQNYNILLASKEPVHCVLKNAATTFWNWDALLGGENVTGRYYNQPPDRSWYGHYEGPLEDPFSEIWRPTLLADDQPGGVLHDVLSQETFWRDLQTFINTHLGSVIISESRIRGNLGYYLQKYGPPVLKSVTNTDVLRMVDILISEKKWVQESPSDIIPFNLTSSAGITSS